MAPGPEFTECGRRLKTDPLSTAKLTPFLVGSTTSGVGTRTLARTRVGEEGRDRRGGMGRGPPSSPQRRSVDQGDRSAHGPFAQHGAQRAALGWFAELCAPSAGVGARCVRRRDSPVVASRTDDAGDGDRRADRVGALDDPAQGARGRVASVVPAPERVRGPKGRRRLSPVVWVPPSRSHLVP
jgi:hypothetical protein